MGATGQGRAEQGRVIAQISLTTTWMQAVTHLQANVMKQLPGRTLAMTLDQAGFARQCDRTRF